jgi:hypothetical protein
VTPDLHVCLKLLVGNHCLCYVCEQAVILFLGKSYYSLRGMKNCKVTEKKTEFEMCSIRLKCVAFCNVIVPQIIYSFTFV